MDKKTSLFMPRAAVRRQMCVGLVANVMSMSGGIILILSSMILPKILEGSAKSDEETLRVSTEEGSWFASLFSIGLISGSLFGGLQSDFLGRKSSMMIDSVVMAFGFFSIALATSFPILLFGRFIGGHATGSAMVSLPVYIGEISHPVLRGGISAMFGFLHYFGALVLTTCSAILPWRTTMFIMGTVPIANLFGFLLCPESPTWLLRSNKKDKAFESLLFLRVDRLQAMEALQMIEDNLLKDNKLEHTSNSFLNSLKNIVEPSFLKPFFLLVFMLTFVQVWTGTAFINFYMVTFFENMNIPLDPYLMSAFLCLYRMILGVFGVSVIASFKRRAVYLTLSSIICFANASLALHQFLLAKGFFLNWGLEKSNAISFLPLISIGLLYGSFAIGFGSIVRTLQGELLPADKRSFGVGLIGILEGISVFVIAKISPFMMTSLQMHGCFGIFALVALSAICVSYLFLPETKGVSLEDIENHYRKGDMEKSDLT